MIGGGSGGYAAARTAADAGLRTVVIEGGREVGGLCILKGCMPTKALLYAAEVLHLAGQPAVWGLQTQKAGFDFAQVMARKDKLIQEFAEHRRQHRRRGRLNLCGPTPGFWMRTRCNWSTGEKLSAKHFVISTGSVGGGGSPARAGGSRLFDERDDALALKRLPKSLIVLGGGAVAVELAQFFARFDVKVTLIQRGAHLLNGFDTDAADTLAEVFRREGMGVYTNTKLTGARRKGEGKEVAFLHDARETRVEAAEILLAMGRVPNTDALDPAKAGVATEKRRIVTNEEMRTSAKHIYGGRGLHCRARMRSCIWRCNRGRFGGAEHRECRTGRNWMDYRLVTHRAVFTEPQMAATWFDRKSAALEGNIPHRTAKYCFAGPRAANRNDHHAEAKDGFVKLLANPETGEIIGGGCAGPAGGELIHEIIAGDKHKRMTVHELARRCRHYHPTLAEHLDLSGGGAGGGDSAGGSRFMKPREERRTRNLQPPAGTVRRGREVSGAA